MKKVFALAIALTLALSMAVFASAAASADAAEAVNELVAAYGEDALVAVLQEELASYDLAITSVDELDAAMLPASAGDSLAAAIIDRFSIDPDSDMGQMIQNSASNEFVSFIAGLYYEGVDPTVATTKAPVIEDPTEPDDVTPSTGSSPVAAIAAFATISVAAAAAFVCLKKKED